jgi:branched-chain amino acid transport system substrate-binding protein
MSARSMFASLMTVAFAAFAATGAAAQDAVKVGLILPMTGQQASTGKQIAAAARLYPNLADSGSILRWRTISGEPSP